MYTIKTLTIEANDGRTKAMQYKSIQCFKGWLIKTTERLHHSDSLQLEISGRGVHCCTLAIGKVSRN